MSPSKDMQSNRTQLCGNAQDRSSKTETKTATKAPNSQTEKFKMSGTKGLPRVRIEILDHIALRSAICKAQSCVEGIKHRYEGNGMRKRHPGTITDSSSGWRFEICFTCWHAGIWTRFGNVVVLVHFFLNFRFLFFSCVLRLEDGGPH